LSTLRLEKMELLGFKSFGDRTEVVFPEGITAVVGPNGCGKSNIGDALNWVLGEQSAKMLRGSSMEDVIFNGSDGRKAQGMAEVSLHLAKGNGAIEPRTVVLTRRLFRSGESEYLVNGARARLKDIQEVLRDARVGAKTYATIEQGRIDQILNAKPKERRLIIEDAAGISGFKQKRRLTELKLDATQANLLRVSDVVQEVRRQINALKRQAAKARRYGRLRGELRAKECVRFGLKALSGDDELRRLREEEAVARDADAAVAAREGVLEAALAAERRAAEEAGRLLHEGRQSLHRIEIEIGDEEARIRSCRDRVTEGKDTVDRLAAEAASLSERQEALVAESRAGEAAEKTLREDLLGREARLAERREATESAESRLRDAREALESARRGLFESIHAATEIQNRKRALEEALLRTQALRVRRASEREMSADDRTRLQAEAARLQEEESRQRASLGASEEAHGRTDAALREARARLADRTADCGRAREEEQSAAARLGTLEDVATRFAGVSDGVRVLLTAGPSAGVRTHGVVADYVEAGEEIEAAAEAYLAALLPAVILEDDADARGAAALLRKEGAGRTSFLCKGHPVGEPVVGTKANGRGVLPREIEMMNDPRVRGRLREHLKLKSSNGFLHERIGDAILVDSLETALALHRVHPEADYLAATGEVVFASGLVAAGGRQQAAQGLLAHARKIQEARVQRADAGSRVADRTSQVEESRGEVSRLESAISEERQRLEDARHRLVEISHEAERCAEDARRAGRAAEVLSEEIVALDAEEGALAPELEAVLRTVAEAERTEGEREQEIQERSSALASLEARLRDLGEEVSVLRAEVAVFQQGLAGAERERDRRREDLAGIAARIDALTAAAALTRERAREASELLARTEAELLVHLQEREEWSAKLSAEEERLAKRRADLETGEGSLKEARAIVGAARETLRVAELARARGESDRAHLDDLCAQELGCTAEEAAATAGEELRTADPASIEGEIAEVRDRIERIGPVNMMAIEEFTELEQRYAFLTAQQRDLEQSMASLKETIRRINSASREQFLSAFEAIRSSYQEIFRVLFGGGRADLRLEEGEDVLECGIEILAQPPGKKLGNVQLMSGGEKAMAAISLLFAIFRNQPSPFCLLDEVDAALDDVNVNRFTRMLREYSGTTQFILITHNKLSMDAANLLYGVTMEEPGVSRLVSLKLD